MDTARLRKKQREYDGKGRQLEGRAFPRGLLSVTFARSLEREVHMCPGALNFLKTNFSYEDNPASTC
jgi:hypothetical protein